VVFQLLAVSSIGIGSAGSRTWSNRRSSCTASVVLPDPAPRFDSVNETQVLAGQREFRERLRNAGIPHESHEVPGGHVFRPDMFRIDLDGIIARLRSAALVSPSSATPQL
jgi:S-formylglutathione hydrolase FrmB